MTAITARCIVREMAQTKFSLHASFLTISVPAF